MLSEWKKATRLSHRLRLGDGCIRNLPGGEDSLFATPTKQSFPPLHVKLHSVVKVDAMFRDIGTCLVDSRRQASRSLYQMPPHYGQLASGSTCSAVLPLRVRP